MNNITYSIIESNSDTSNSNSNSNSNGSDKIWEEISLIEKEKEKTKENAKEKTKENAVDKESEICARKMDYELNFSMKYVSSILDFYNIKKNRLNKKQIIKKIVDYELDKKNMDIVEERKRLFENFIELKGNSHFSKYIVGTIV
jgi:hypothetical protein